MVLGSILTSVFVNTLSFVAYCKGFSGKSVDADEFNWSYMEREGKEQDTCDVVVFLAGFGAFKESWVRVACGVDKKYQVIIPDLPGQGCTTPADAFMDYTVGNQARRLHAFIEKVVPADKKVHLVGISMGGMISGVYAAKYPEHIKSLTMICPAGIFMKNRSDAMRIMEDTRRNLLLAQTAEEINEMHKMTTHDAKDLPHFLAGTIGKERAKQLPVLEKMASDCLLTPTILEEFLPKIRAKTLLMWGRNDRLLDVSCVERVNELMIVDTEKHVIVFEECGHVVQHQKHEECTNAINQFLAGKVPTGILEDVLQSWTVKVDGERHGAPVQVEVMAHTTARRLRNANVAGKAPQAKATAAWTERSFTDRLPRTATHTHSTVMVLGSFLTSTMLNTLSFVAYCKGFGGKIVDVNEFSWSYMEREGKEQDKTDAVVFLHGFSSMKEAWVRVATGIDKKYQVIIPDLPGQGRTTPADALFSYTVDNQARRLHAFIETTLPADKKVHLVGCSMGGMIAGVYAAKYPERVRSLTMVCPAGVTMKNKSDGLRILEETGKNMLLAYKADDVVEMNKLINHSAKDIPRFVASIIGAERIKQMSVIEKIVADCLMEPTILEEFLPQIRAKTLVMWGKQDRVLDVSCVERLEETMTVDHKHVIVFDNCGHLVQHERYKECTNAINQFLDGNVPTGIIKHKA